jgi:hypothetical protein
MKRRVIFFRVNYLLLAALLLAASVNAFADVAIRKPDKLPKSSSFTTGMKVSPDEKATEARLLIPRDVWQQMRAGLDGDDTKAAALTSFNPGGAQTVMAGLFLSLALAFGGLWLVRSRERAGKFGPAALCLAALVLCGAAARAVFANAGPPPAARSLTSKILTQDLQWWGAYGQVKVEVTDDVDRITLVLPKQKQEQPR